VSAPIRMRALEALAEVFARLVPELAHVQAGQADAPQRSPWPNLSVTGSRWRYEPTQDGTIHALLPPTRAVFEVGRLSTTLQLHLGTKNTRERARMEHAINQLFLSQRGHPGILTLKLNDCWGALVSYELDDTGWDDDEALSKEFWATIALGCTAPALVERGGLYDIDQLHLGITPDLTTEFTLATFDRPLVEVVSIAEDGTTAVVP